MPCCCRNRFRRRTQPTVRVFDDNNFIPSAVQLNYSLTQSMQPGEPVIFAETNYNTGASFSPRNDGLGVDIVTSGVYKISFTGTVRSTANQTIGIAISLNGSPIPQSEILQTIASDAYFAISSSTIFKVISPSADIGVLNVGTNSFELTNAKLDIVRIGNF